MYRAEIKKYLLDLITRISGERDNPKTRKGSEKESWKAYRESEKIADQAFFPVLEEMLLEETKTTYLDAIYTIIGHLGGNLKSQEIIGGIVNNLKHENNEEIIYAMLTAIYRANVPLSEGIKEIQLLAKHNKDIIQNIAIRCLVLDANKSKDTKELLVELWKNTEEEVTLEIIEKVLINLDAQNLLTKAKKEIDRNKVLEDIEQESEGSIRRSLRTYKKMNFFAKVYMKKDLSKPFIAKIVDIDYRGDDQFAIFERCNMTNEFPGVDGKEVKRFETDVKKIFSTDLVVPPK